MLLEPMLWLLTSVVDFFAALRDPSSDSLQILLPVVFTMLTACRTIAPSLIADYPNKIEAKTNRIWRQPVHQPEPAPLETYAPWQGLTMSRVLIPFLFRSMAIIRATSFEKDSQRTISPWYAYANVAPLLLGVYFWGYQRYKHFFYDGTATSVLVVCVIVCWTWGEFYTLPSNRKTLRIQIMFWAGTWTLVFNCIYFTPPLHKVFTKGELTVVTCGIALALSAMLEEIRELSFLPYQTVALTGCVGCGLAIAFLYYCNMSRRPIYEKLGFLVSFPLLLVELTLRKLQLSEPTHFLVPYSINWLWRFLMETEKYPLGISVSQLQQSFSFPRYVWLLYWAIDLFLGAIVLVLLHTQTETSETTPSKSRSTVSRASVSRKFNTVVARKFFHGVAVLLFMPTAIFAPQLLSLSYAIATALLMVVEYVRADVPLVQNFYNQYLDPSKDDSSRVIVSHTALILGCALPHWIAECCFNLNTTAEIKDQVALVLLLRLWGVISLGIGDALGAIIGTWYGRTRWGGPTRRTVEGSTAMLIGMAWACYGLVGNTCIAVWLPVVVLTTLLEVATLQIDNLVLPLAGSAWILFLASFSKLQ